MKKILIVALMLISMLFVGCDNNKGPFTREYINGESVLMSDGKPAKGIVGEDMYTDTAQVTIFRAEYDDGFINGDIVVFNNKNKEMFKGTCKKIDSNTYDIDWTLNDGATIKGTVAITSEELENLFREPGVNGYQDGVNLNNWFDKVAIDATINSNNYKATKKNGKFDGKVLINNSEITYENGVKKDYTIRDKEGNLVSAKKTTGDTVETWEYSNLYDQNTLEEYKEYQGDEEICKYTGSSSFYRIITPKDKATKYPNGTRIDIDFIAIYKMTIDVSEKKDTDIIYHVVERKEYPKEKYGNGLSYDDMMEVYYEFIGSDLAKGKFGITSSNNNQNTNSTETYHQDGATLSSFADKEVYTAEVKNMMITPDNKNLILMEAENGEYFYLVHAKGYGSDLVQDWKNYVKNGEGMETLIPLVHLTGDIYKGMIFKDNQDAYNYADKEGFQIYR
mgnify:CR=1 FL=1